jgi:hypothetical protein
MRSRMLFWTEAAMSGLTASLLLLTTIWPDWIEAAFGADPDHHDGTLERGIVVVLLVATVTFALLARRQWHRLAVSK